MGSPALDSTSDSYWVVRLPAALAAPAFLQHLQGAGLISFAVSLYVCKRSSARISVAL